MGEGSNLNAAIIPMVEASSVREEFHPLEAEPFENAYRSPIIVEDRGSAKKYGKGAAMEVEDEGQNVLNKQLVIQEPKDQLIRKGKATWRRKGQKAGRLNRTTSTEENTNLQKGDIRRTVRDGLNTKILAYPWVIDLPTGIPALKSEVSSIQLTWVKELMYADGRSWNRGLIQSLFTDESCNAILKMKDLNPAEKDRWVWSADTKGKFTVSSAYSAAIK
ncbi:ribonuclease H-like superfamily protein [Striga asiatica]|uniref:Ribonuclease H-like superfamily protein n=1 Tax=Striga asiatica TaxID=4170 RepID=A0A5A7PUW3_STRAF|nr:ribonuclease H-like superfamily protein [Striga asiatica]